GKTFIISKFPAIAGRKIITQYVASGLPKIGDYASNEEIMLQLMKYVAVVTESGSKIPLSTSQLIDNHVRSESHPFPFEFLMKLEAAMMEYNCSFFQNGAILSSLKDIPQKAQQWITKILKDLSVQSSPQNLPPTSN
ncbi:MAG TPA: hypothetical protein VN457_03905, partial [Chlamydiales bacterium]|nr:hypothetical protein [Chlamydiales bacterium]